MCKFHISATTQTSSSCVRHFPFNESPGSVSSRGVRARTQRVRVPRRSLAERNHAPPVPLSQSLSFSRATHAVVVGDTSVAETKRQWNPDGSGVSGAGSGGVYMCVCVCALRLKIRGLLKWPCKYGNVTIDRLVQFGS